MADIFVSQAGAGAADGSDRDNPYSVSGHNAASFVAGDVIWILGQLTSSLIPPSSGALGGRIVYRFDDAQDPGSVTLASGSPININALSHVELYEPYVIPTGTANGIFMQGATNGIVITRPRVRSSSTGRPIYVFGNAHTNFLIDAPVITHGNGDITSSNDSEAIYIWGNNATAGSGGELRDVDLLSVADSVADGSSAFVGLSLEDWDDLTISIKRIEGFFTGLCYQDCDDNTVEVTLIKDCKSPTSGQGVLVAGTSTGNKTKLGTYDGNYEGYQDNSTVGGNEIIAAKHRNHEVNAVSYTATGATQGRIVQQDIEHSPDGGIGHGIVVQNGGASTRVQIRNNRITCDVTGANAQCVAINGTYDEVDIDANSYETSNGAIVGALGGTDYETLQQWQGALAGDADVIGKDVNSTIGPLPLDGMPLINTGVAALTLFNDAPDSAPWSGAGTGATTMIQASSAQTLFGVDVWRLANDGSNTNNRFQTRNGGWPFVVSNDTIWLAVYVEDGLATSGLQFFIANGASIATDYSWSTITNTYLHHGWNLLPMSFTGATHVSPFELSDVGLGFNTASAFDAMRLRINGVSSINQLYYAAGLLDSVNSHPYVSIVFDDCDETAYTNGHSYSQSRGVPLTHFIIGSLIGTSGRLTLAEVNEMMAGGDDIGFHGDERWDNAADPVALIQADVDDIRKLGLSPRGLWTAAYPSGEYGQNAGDWRVTQDALERAGIRYARTTKPTEAIIPVTSPYHLGAIPLNNTTSLAEAQAAVDRAAALSIPLIFYGHAIDTVADSLTWTTSDWQSLVDHINTAAVTAVTMPEMCAALQNRALSGEKWWAGEQRPVGLDGEPFSDFHTSIGANQSKLTPFHPNNL